MRSVSATCVEVCPLRPQTACSPTPALLSSRTQSSLSVLSSLDQSSTPHAPASTSKMLQPSSFQARLFSSLSSRYFPAGLKVVRVGTADVINFSAQVRHNRSTTDDADDLLTSSPSRRCSYFQLCLKVDVIQTACTACSRSRNVAQLVVSIHYQ